MTCNMYRYCSHGERLYLCVDSHRLVFVYNHDRVVCMKLTYIEQLTWIAWGIIGMLGGIPVGLRLRSYLDNRKSQRITLPKWNGSFLSKETPDTDQIRIIGTVDDEATEETETR